jgi:hypothetical protein
VRQTSQSEFTAASVLKRDSSNVARNLRERSEKPPLPTFIPEKGLAAPHRALPTMRDSKRVRDQEGIDRQAIFVRSRALEFRMHFFDSAKQGLFQGILRPARRRWSSGFGEGQGRV